MWEGSRRDYSLSRLATLARALPARDWHQVRWRPGSKGPLRSRFARLPVWLAHRCTVTRTVPTEAVELLVEWPREAPAPTTYWFADLRGEGLGLRRFVRLTKGRWRIEMDYGELNEEVGLDHFEGRSWIGWHHHVTLASLAYAFVMIETVRRKKRRRRRYRKSAAGCSTCSYGSVTGAPPAAVAGFWTPHQLNRAIPVHVFWVSVDEFCIPPIV